MLSSPLFDVLFFNLISHDIVCFSHILDENKFFAAFVLVNNYHGDVLVTTNVSGQLEIEHLKPTKKVVKSKKWKTKKWFSVSAVDATTNRTVDINEHSVIHLETTIKDLISLNVLYIQGK